MVVKCTGTGIPAGFPVGNEVGKVWVCIFLPVGFKTSPRSSKTVKNLVSYGQIVVNECFTYISLDT